MITDIDVKKLKEVFATKEDLRQEIQKVRNDLAESVATKQGLEDLGYRLTEEMRNHRVEILGGLDKVMGELKVHREEREALEQRVTDIEAVPIIASELRRKRS